MQKINPQDLKQPDIFVSEVSVIWEWAHKHQKVLGTLLGSLLLIGIGYSLYEVFDGSREKKAQEALFESLRTYEKKRDGFELAEKPKKDAKAKDKKAKDPSEDEEEDTSEIEAALGPNVQKATGDLEKDYGSVLRDLEKVANDHSGTKASVIAALTAGQIYRDYSQADKGLNLMTAISKKVPNNDLLRGAVALNLGDFYQMKGECDKAVSQWDPLTKEPRFSFVKAEALLREGLCYRLTGQAEKSNEIFKKLSTEKELMETRAGQAAKKYMKLQSSSEKGTPANTSNNGSKG